HSACAEWRENAIGTDLQIGKIAWWRFLHVFQKIFGFWFAKEQRLYFSTQFCVGGAGAIQEGGTLFRIPGPGRQADSLDLPPTFRSHLGLFGAIAGFTQWYFSRKAFRRTARGSFPPLSSTAEASETVGFDDDFDRQFPVFAMRGSGDWGI